MNTFGYNESVNESQSSHRQYPSHTPGSTSAKAPWTAARCNRLLRPLLSKVALLRKEGQYGTDVSATRCSTDISKIQCGDGGSGEHYSRSTREIADEDTEWGSNPRPSKKVKRTYSAKSRASPLEDHQDNVESEAWLRRSASEAVIGLPSSINLEGGSEETSSIVENGKHRTLASQKTREFSLPQQLPKHVAPYNWKLVDGICKGLVALLHATSFSEPHSTTGCRSLFSTCLRTTPHYIAQEEIFSKDNDPDSDVDISSVVYSDLEEFGSMPNGGWEPLREVVRAHGIKIVNDAIEEGVLGLPVARHLFYLCLDALAYDEAQRIIESLTALATSTSQPLPNKAKQLPRDLRMITYSLDLLTLRTGRLGCMYRHTAAMLEKGILPLAWISSKPMIGVWNGVIQSIAQEDEFVLSAALLLRTAVAMSCSNSDAMPSMDMDDLRSDIHIASRRPALRSSDSGSVSESIVCAQRRSTKAGGSLAKRADSEVLSTLSNVFTVLSAITRLQNPTAPPSSCASSTWIASILHGMSLTVRHTVDLGSTNAKLHGITEVYDNSVRLPLLAAGFTELSTIGCSNPASHHQVPSLSALADLPFGNEASSFAGLYLCSIARCCGRARSEDPFQALETMVQDLVKASNSICYDAPTRKLCGNLALAAAFAFAEDTSRPSHLDWALQVESNLTGKGIGTPKPGSVKTPARSVRQSRSGYRWEEGICEWIAKTPNLLLPKSSIEKPGVSDLNGNIKLLESLEKRPLPSSEISPCAASKKPRKGAPQLHGNEMKAFHVLIPVSFGLGGQDEGSKKPHSGSIRQRLKQTSNSRSFPKIHVDDDCDELSAAGSSQEKAPALALSLSTAREPENLFVSGKRKRCPEGKSSKRALKSPTPTSPAIEKLQSQECRLELDAEEDELALLFRW